MVITLSFSEMEDKKNIMLKVKRPADGSAVESKNERLFSRIMDGPHDDEAICDNEPDDCQEIYEWET